MSVFTDKIEYLRQVTGLEISESDFVFTQITEKDDFFFVPVGCFNQSGCVKIPKQSGLFAAKLLQAYLADSADKTDGEKIETLLYKAFTGMITADETVTLVKTMPNKKYYVVLLKTDGAEKCAELTDYLSALSTQNDFIVGMDDCEIVYLKEIDGGYDGSEELAEVLFDGITEESKINLVVCSGGFADKPEQLVRAYRRALDAYVAGEGGVRHYRDCALAALLNKAPVKSVNDYYEYLTFGMNFAELDAELRDTAKTFMDCNMSCAATAKKLYIHRNTLLKRLDKILHCTGLDIRQFRQAQSYDYIIAAEKAIKNKK